MTGKIERQLVTSGIKHWGLGGYSSVLPRIKFGVTGQDSSPQSPTISYRQPLSLSVKSQPHKWHIWFLPTHEPTLKKPKEPFFSNARQPSENNLLLLTKFRQVQNKTMTLGQKIRELREQAGLKQRELAYQLGIGEGFLSKVENDQKPLKREDLTKLNELFKTPIEELESLWLANKVYSIVRDEETALSALKVAEEQITYNTLRNGK